MINVYPNLIGFRIQKMWVLNITKYPGCFGLWVYSD